MDVSGDGVWRSVRNDKEAIMKIRVIGAGFYGCHVANELLRDGHDVEVHEIKDEVFGGASGSIPARVHQGFHYPRSKKTRDACQSHAKEFEAQYSDFIRSIGTNIYAIAADRSLVDFDQYVDTLTGEVEFEVIDNVEKYGLKNVEGAVLTKEKHIITDDVKEYFSQALDGRIKFGIKPEAIDDPGFDVTIDATFCAYDNYRIDRYEPCFVGLLKGDVTKAVTIMDGPFASVYPWNPERGLCSISSARYTPFSKSCRTWGEAEHVLKNLSKWDILRCFGDMTDDLGKYYSNIDDYDYEGYRLSIRAMPLSGADTRLVDIIRVGETGIRIRAGKIDAVIEAARVIRGML
jgi:hypothetical protein